MFYKNNLFKFYLFRRIVFTYHYLKCKLTFIPKKKYLFSYLDLKNYYNLLFIILGQRNKTISKYFSLL